MWSRIAKWLLIVELIFISFAVLYVIKIALAQTIGIGVSPAVLKYNFPAVYSQEFCFFNQGDTDAVYVIQSGDIKVLNEMNFSVPANTNFDNCVKKTLQLMVDKSGYFYVAAYPKINQSATVSIIRRVGIKVELASYPTQTISSSSSGGVSGAQTTTTTIRNISSENISIARNQTSNVTIRINTSTTTIANQTLNTGNLSSSGFTDAIKVVAIIVIVTLVIVGLIYFASEAGWL
jgi:hypothetical protein